MKGNKCFCRGFLFVETMIALVAAVLFFGLTSKVLVIICRDVPVSNILVDRHGVILEALEQMHHDVGQARSIVGRIGPFITNDKNLIVELQDGIYIYSIEDRQLVRYALDPDTNVSVHVRGWALEDARVDWQIWKDGDTAYAVEVHTHLIHKTRIPHKRLMNNYLFFVHTLGAQVQR